MLLNPVVQTCGVCDCLIHNFLPYWKDWPFFQCHSHKLITHLKLCDFFEYVWVIVSGIKQILCYFSTELVLLLWQKPWHAFCCHTFHSKVFNKNPLTTSPWNPRSSNACTVSCWLWFTAAYPRSTFSGILTIKGLPEQWIKTICTIILNIICIAHWVLSESLLLSFW